MLKIKRKAMVFSNGLMVNNTKATGRMVNNTELEYQLTEKDRKLKLNGRMEEDLDKIKELIDKIIIKDLNLYLIIFLFSFKTSFLISFKISFKISFYLASSLYYKTTYLNN